MEGKAGRAERPEGRGRELVAEADCGGDRLYQELVGGAVQLALQGRERGH